MIARRPAVAALRVIRKAHGSHKPKERRSQGKGAASSMFGLPRLLAAPLGDGALTYSRWLPAREDDRSDAYVKAVVEP